MRKTIVNMVEDFIRKYVTLKEDYYAFPLALWVIHTHCWNSFDTTPYLVITKPVKRAGGTRLMEVLMYMSFNGQTFSPDSPAAMLRVIALSPVKPACFIDEAEKFNAENHPARELLNKGYRRGQTIPKVINGEPMELETFCPKAFVLIGDVYSTLRDRTITVVMRRRSPIETANSPQFRMIDAKDEAYEIREEIEDKVKGLHLDIKANYHSLARLDFLNDRDEEVWQPLFTLCKTICPERMDELKRTAVDMATEKQTAARRESQTAEREADFQENRVILLRDMLTITEGKKNIATIEVVETLKELPTAPWRKFQGRGILDADIAEMLESMYIHPKTVRLSNKKGTKGQHVKGTTLKGYKREDLLAAAKLIGLIE